MHCSVGDKDAQKQDLLSRWTQELANKQATLLACATAFKTNPTGPQRRALIVSRKNAGTEAEACRSILRWLREGSVGSAHAEAFVDMLYCQTRAETLARFVDDAKKVIGLDNRGSEDLQTEVERPAQTRGDSREGEAQRDPPHDGVAPGD